MTAVQRVEAKPEKIQHTTWKEYAVRFAFGGLVTAAVGIVGKAFGPGVAGLFLAFPAILPASITLIERHQSTRAAGADALGSAAGCVGLFAFGAVVWALAPRAGAWIVLSVALVVWLAVSLAVWWTFMRLRGTNAG